MIKRTQRDLVVFMKYTQIIKQIGPRASSMKKSNLYAETADYFFVEGPTVQKIILSVLKKLKSGGYKDFFAENELSDIMVIINQIHKDSDDRREASNQRELQQA